LLLKDPDPFNACSLAKSDAACWTVVFFSEGVSFPLEALKIIQFFLLTYLLCSLPEATKRKVGRKA
jgi:hypothetical protein